MRNYLSGGKIAGGNPANKRVENDFYATNPEAVEMLLEEYNLQGRFILEPCAGNGNIAKVLKNKGYVVTCIDIVDRGYPDTFIGDFLKWNSVGLYDCVITNPPFSLAQKIIERSIRCLPDNGCICMFLKIQFLEGVGRKEFFEKYPPKYVYVFRSRMATWNNGNQLTTDGKKWQTTMCHAWFIWEKSNGKMSDTEPIIRWL